MCIVFLYNEARQWSKYSPKKKSEKQTFRPLKKKSKNKK